MSDEEDVGKMKTLSRVSQASASSTIMSSHPANCDKIAIEPLVLYIYHLESALPSMSANHFLGPMGTNGALTEEDQGGLESIIAHHQQIVVEIEAEAAIALKALKTTTKQRIILQIKPKDR